MIQIARSDTSKRSGSRFDQPIPDGFSDFTDSAASRRHTNSQLLVKLARGALDGIGRRGTPYVGP